MKGTRFIALLLVFATILSLGFSLSVSAEEDDSSGTVVPDNPGITSGNAAVAYCIEDDQFLWADRIDERVDPVVAAKLMACMVVCDILAERGLSMDSTEVTVTDEAVKNAGDVYDVRIPIMGLKKDSVYTVQDLLSATLVACANDAVAALASGFGQTYLGGDINTFVERMNKKALALGLENTKFTNPTGLYDADQYSTPREVVLLTAAFYRYNSLVNLSNVESFIFNKKSTVRSKNYLKSNYFVNGFLNRNAIGLIAGQLDRNGKYSLLTASQKDGRTYIFAVMCASGMIVDKNEEKITYSFGDGNAYDDMNKLIKWVRDSFRYLTIAKADTIVGELRVNLGNSADHVIIVPAEEVEKLVLDIPDVVPEVTVIYDESTVYKKEFNGREYDTIDAPVNAGQKIGTIIYSYNGIEIAKVDAVARESVESDGVKAMLANTKSFLFGGVMKTVLYIIVGIIAAWLIFSAVAAIVRTAKKVKHSRPASDNTKKQTKTKKGKKKKSEPDLKSTTREIR